MVGYGSSSPTNSGESPALNMPPDTIKQLFARARAIIDARAVAPEHAVEYAPRSLEALDASVDLGTLACRHCLSNDRRGSLLLRKEREHSAEPKLIP